ncbi:LOW QUALITY PROTEIN: acetylcholinesterase-like, partial [Pollicipes pollicipes]|uniref:LOW QUALITY PROTEIN: acetylcholinesterase-like n=1 Tax=Pollicipes pollicipes TaxID=41117 RepID=UPI0018849F9C
LLRLCLLALASWAAAAAEYEGGGDSNPYGTDAELEPGDDLLVETHEGLLEGVTLTAGSGRLVDAWLGVPFAQPPVGPLRFRPPVPAASWEGVRPAQRQPNSCWQVLDEFFGDFDGATMWNANTPRSEDCLYLSVTRPRPRPSRPAPVLVWIYGGGFYSGTATLDVYEPSVLAAEGGVIVVAIQYRVASLGFLQLDAAPGNVGLLDQVLALRWVQRNIARFGGDPERVTLFGNSAGAVSVSMHLLSPLSAPLFRRAVLQSGSATNPWAVLSAEEARRRALRLAEEVDCPRAPAARALACLRRRVPRRLVNAEFFTTGICEFPFVPVVDGEFLPEDPAEALAAGRFKRAELLAGSVAEEGNYFLLYYLAEYANLTVVPSPSRADFTRHVAALLPRLSEPARLAVSHEYTDWTRPYAPATLRDGLDKLVGDRQFACGVNDFAAAYAREGGAVFVYQLRQRAPGSLWPQWTGVLHGDEVAYVFGLPLRAGGSFSREEVTLSKRMIGYWTNFAKTGDPNQSGDQCALDGGASADWPLYEPSGQRYLVLAAKAAV